MEDNLSVLNEFLTKKGKIKFNQFFDSFYYNNQEFKSCKSVVALCNFFNNLSYIYDKSVSLVVKVPEYPVKFKDNFDTECEFLPISDEVYPYVDINFSLNNLGINQAYNYPVQNGENKINAFSSFSIVSKKGELVVKELFFMVVRKLENEVDKYLKDNKYDYEKQIKNQNILFKISLENLFIVNYYPDIVFDSYFITGVYSHYLISSLIEKCYKYCDLTPKLNEFRQVYSKKEKNDYLKTEINRTFSIKDILKEYGINVKNFMDIVQLDLTNYLSNSEKDKVLLLLSDFRNKSVEVYNSIKNTELSENDFQFWNLYKNKYNEKSFQEIFYVKDCKNRFNCLQYNLRYILHSLKNDIIKYNYFNDNFDYYGNDCVIMKKDSFKLEEKTENTTYLKIKIGNDFGIFGI